MPARQPFTALCRAAARSRQPGWADLHTHTVYSDGTYTPEQVVDLARRTGLKAVAVTDHDTLAGYEPARSAAGSALEVIPGVEVTAEFRGRELHLLGYFVRPDDAALLAALETLRQRRSARFWALVARLQEQGVRLDEEELRTHAESRVLGRRFLAEALVKAREAQSVRHAFHRYLDDRRTTALPKARLPVREAIALVRGAGGVAAWAHPSYDCNKDTLEQLRRYGLGAVEAAYSGFQARRVRELRELAAAAGFAVTGGSDCHGPDQPGRVLGAAGVSQDELEALRRLASP